MHPEADNNIDPQIPDRREMVEKLGRLAVYAAPFTVLALTRKADAATGTGPVKHK